MIRLARAEPPELISPPVRVAHAPGVGRAGNERAYDRSFWLTYLANTSLMMAVSLLFRYGDFVALLGGGELALGLIVGVGMVGSLATRMAQGVGLDRYGPRRIWLLSLALVVVTLLAHRMLTTAHGPAVYLVRVAFNTGIAGAFGASITYVSLRAPAARMAEMIGMLGSSGFLGMALGTQLGDWLCRAQPLERWHLDRLFAVAAGWAACALICTWFATNGEVRPLRRKRPPIFWLVRRYHPGPLLLMGAAMGMGLGLPGTFLRPYTQRLGIAEIGAFFGCYALTAFAMRVAARRLPDRVGVRPTILLGMGSLALGMVLYLFVGSAWSLMLPGVAVGIAHALLFPAVVSGAAGTFPLRYRGLGTTLVLATFDIGNLIGMPLAGTLVELADRAGLPPYPTMFLTIGALLTMATGYYALLSRGKSGKRKAESGAAARVATPRDVSP